MALQSQFTRIETAILQLIKPDILSSAEMRELIYAVLEFDMVEHNAKEYSVQETEFSFKAVDGSADRWRRMENAVFEDYLKCGNPAEDCILETLPEAFDFTGRQIAFVYLSRHFDSSGGAVLRWDVNPDAVDGDLAAGEFLTADLSPPVVLDWDTITPLDIYPTRKVVFRFTMAGEGKLYWLRMKMAVLGSLERMAKDTSIIALYAAARWIDQRVNKTLNANAHPQTTQTLQNRATHFRNRAKGNLGGGSDVKSGAGASGGVVAGSRPSNPWSDRLTGKV